MAGPGNDAAASPVRAAEAAAASKTGGTTTETAAAETASALMPPPLRYGLDGAVAHLQAPPTTAVSSIDIQTMSFPDGTRGTFTTTPEERGTESGTDDAGGADTGATGGSPLTASSPGGSLGGGGTGAPARRVVSSGASISTSVESGGYVVPVSGLHRHGRHGGGHGGPGTAVDAMSVLSIAPTMRPAGDLVSLAAGDFHGKSRAWTLLRAQAPTVEPFERTRLARVPYSLAAFDREFDPIPDSDGDSDDDSARLAAWKGKLKHYMILSSAGKPIWSRHGDLALINASMGVVQTILSFYEGADSPLHSFTAGSARFVVVTEGPLYLVAISRLGESDAQLRDQLRALYMQILSTLTLPALTGIFAHRPSSDLRKPLQGTEGLLASLADSFTRGSASALLGALECLRLRKTQRAAITSAFLRQRADKLLYGLIVAGGRLVSVVRPRRHSLHPTDLQLIFNMLFASGGLQAGGGENWIPLCLPAFNSSGYLYMYVSFFEPDGVAAAADAPPDPSQAIAVVLISPDKESFFALKAMREKLAQTLAKNGSLAVIRAAVAAGRPQVADLLRRPGAGGVGGPPPIRHFLYKSRANVQFVMSALGPDDGDNDDGGNRGDAAEEPAALRRRVRRGREAQRRLMTLYHQLHAAVHARHSQLKILHCVGEDATSLAWVTPAFEFYCVAGPNASRAGVTQDANRLIQWAKREEERLFIIGGGVF